ncbi:alpha/beta fold hydrolase [Conexibacter sp. SYSU D00693]|uniref:alpha/beta fold hydrolase n=1 Tax=Conexibacter sp. SYSU D00693 TaxID=2812560 RepID=UPI00196B609C|nr:alpha/beta fold hydrolase [Conexibacter sp. SYSU D00693]
MPEISAARYRAGQGEPLVLIHGFTATWRCWEPVLAPLVAQFDVFAPTLPGHDGGAAWPTAGRFGLQDAVDLVEAELDEQGMTGRVHVVGNSMGGTIALELARRGRALSCTALSPGAGWFHGDAEGERIIKFFKRQQKMARASAPHLDRVMRRPVPRRLALRDVMLHGELVQPADAAAMTRSSTKCEVVDLVYGAIRDGSAILADLGDVPAPVIVAWARHDRILPLERHAPRFRNEIKDVDFRILEGCGHVPMWDDPALVVKTIQDGVQAGRRAAAQAAAA